MAYKKNTATSGKLIEIVYASDFVFIMPCFPSLSVPCNYVEQVSRLLQVTKALRVSKVIAVLFLGLRHTRSGGGSARRPGRLYPRERPGTHFTGGWAGPRAGLDGQKISSPTGFDPGPSSP